MRRTPQLAVAAVTIAASFTSATAAGAQAPTQDRVVGSGDVFVQLNPPPSPRFHLFGFDFDATSGPAGENATGPVRLTFGERLGFSVFEGNVTCLVVSGNRAVVGATGVELGFGSANKLITAVDGGPPNSGLDTLNIANTFGPAPLPPPPIDCSAASFSNQHAVTEGDIAVQDAPALPTSKDQCKNGGWQNFGVFENQGHCVSFVATGGKNRPAGSP